MRYLVSCAKVFQNYVDNLNITARRETYMNFKTENDRNIVVRSMTMLTNGNKLLASMAVDNHSTIVEAIKFILNNAKVNRVTCR